MQAARSLLLDCYCHCGRSKYQPWEVVRAAHEKEGILGGVLVQHLGEQDNGYLIRSAKRAPNYRAVIMVDTEVRGWQTKLRILAAHDVVAGARVVADGSARWRAYAVAASQLGLNVVLYLRAEAASPFQQIRTLALDYPLTTWVVSHVGMPYLSASTVGQLDMIADLSNVTIQLSGWCMLHMEAAFRAALIERLFASIGASRMLWGSNYPVCEIREEIDTTIKMANDLSPDELELILFRTASSVWRLSIQPWNI